MANSGVVSSLARNRNFILLFCAYGISAFGDHLSELGIMREMGLEEGNEKTRIGALMLFFFFLPYVMLGPLAGAIADRLPRRWIMIAADIFRCAVAFSIPWYIAWLGDPFSKLMLLPILCLGLFACFFSPARLSFVPQIVADRHLTQANSLLGGLGPIAAILSFLVGGYLVSDTGEAKQAWINSTFYGDAGTFVLSAILLACIVPGHLARPRALDRRPILTDIVSGFGYIKSHRHVRQLMIFTAIFWTAAGAFKSMIPTVVFDWYGYGATDYWILGLFQAALGVGMLLGAVILTLVGDASRAHHNIIVALIGVGSAILFFSLTEIPWLGGLLSVGVGLFGIWILVSANTLMQRIVPDCYRGKVFGIVDLVNMSGMLLATGLLGIVEIPRLDQHIQWIMRGLALVLIVVGVVLWRHHYRRSPYGLMLSFAKCLNEVLCKFWYRLRREGVCTIPRKGACIITSNHTCGADPSFLSAASPSRLFGFMIAKEFYDIPVGRRLIRALGCIPVRRDQNDIAATKQAFRQLRDKKALCIFIEGRITGPDNKPELRNGVAALALRSGASVIPAHISGVKYCPSLIMTYLFRHRVRIKYGKPVDLSEFGEHKDRRQIAAATEKIWQAIQALGPSDATVYLS